MQMFIRKYLTLIFGLSPWRDVMCDTLCMLGEAAVRGLIDCIINICDKFYLYSQVNFNISGQKSNLGSADPERDYRKIKVVQEPLVSNERVISRSVATIDQDALLEYITQNQKRSF